MRKCNGRWWGPILSVVLALTGCTSASQTVEEVPELVAPVAVNTSYMPVHLEEVELPRILRATVQYREYAQGFSTATTLGRLAVSVGDVVQVGDVLAYADIDALQQEKEELAKRRQEEEQTYQWETAIAANRFINEGLFSEEDKATRTALYQAECASRQKVHEARIEDMDKRTEELEARMEAGTLRADHAGQVVYTSHLPMDRDAKPTTAVVVLRDLEEKVLRLEENEEKTEDLDRRTQRYLYRDGEKVAVKEIPYTQEEQVLARLYGVTPVQYFTTPVIREMEAGSSTNVYFTDDTQKPVPVVAAVSVHGENQPYVYVQAKDGSRERRNVELGRRLGYYVEVLDGLALGELVAFDATEVLPDGTQDYTVKVSTLTVDNHTYTYERSESERVGYTSEYEGRIVETAPGFEKGETVKKGDYLYTIDIGERGARLLEAYYALLEAQEDRTAELTAYDERMVENTKAYQASGDAAYRGYLERENQNLLMEKAMADSRWEKNVTELTAAYEAQKSLHSGDGLVRVTAAMDGTLAVTSVKKGDLLPVGASTYQLDIIRGEDLRVTMSSYPPSIQKPPYSNPASTAEVGESVVIRWNNHEAMGTCIGYYGYGKRTEAPFLETDEDGRETIRFVNASGYDKNGFYLRLDNQEQLEDVLAVEGQATVVTVQFPEVQLENVIILPKDDMVKWSQDGKNQPYVWVEKDGYIYRQDIVVSHSSYGGQVKGTMVLAGLQPGDRILY